MKKYKLPVSWEAYGILQIEAKDDIDFLTKVRNYKINSDELPLPQESDYIDGSFKIEEEDDIILEMNKIEITDIDAAKIYIKSYLDSHTEYPEDKWVQISNDNDLNMWITDDTKARKAALYPVKNGKTDTSVWVKINVRELEKECKNVAKKDS